MPPFSYFYNILLIAASGSVSTAIAGLFLFIFYSDEAARFAGLVGIVWISAWMIPAVIFLREERKNG
jgi:hypothetical protein